MVVPCVAIWSCRSCRIRQDELGMDQPILGGLCDESARLDSDCCVRDRPTHADGDES
jgi:hypothetical protein